MPDVLTAPWPWYVAGPLLGLFAPLLLWLGNRPFGVSSNLRHMCAAIYPGNLSHFRYDWKQEGSWNLMFVLGIVFGGVIAGVLFGNPDPVAISDATRETLTALGVKDFGGLVPDDLFACQRVEAGGIGHLVDVAALLKELEERRSGGRHGAALSLPAAMT